MKGTKKGFHGIWMVPVVLAVVIFFFSGLSGLKNGQSREGRRQLEESIRRAAVSCYAIEGIYPPTVEYLEEQYGIQIDRSRYGVFYEIFAENLMPEITVVELK